MNQLMDNFRIGLGYDVHAFSHERVLFLGGVKIENVPGLLGHSDADVLLHAIIDSILGAAGSGDIGVHFPDSDARYKGISSILLLEKAYQFISSAGFGIINIDTVVICEKPKIAPHIPAMKDKISQALGGLPLDRISIKGKTTEKLGFTGREEGIAVQAVALLSKK